jgi:hypothetical protein
MGIEREMELIPWLLECKPWEPRSKWEAEPFALYSNIRR